MDACWDDRSKWEIYNEKIHRHAHSVHNSKVIRVCLARGNIENVGFPKETRQNLQFIEKYATTGFHIYKSFGIIHAKCGVRLHLVFVFPKGQYESIYIYILYIYIYIYIYIYNWNPEKAHYSRFFITVIHSKFSNLVFKSISYSICKWLIIFGSLYLCRTSYLFI